MQLVTEIPISPETEHLVLKTLWRSNLDLNATLVAVGDEDIGGVPMIYYEFRSPRGDMSRIYPDPDP